MLALGHMYLKDRPQRNNDLETAIHLLNTGIEMYKRSPSGIAPYSVIFQTNDESSEDFVVDDGKFLLRCV